MITTLKNIFGIGPKTDYALMVKQGAIILDVRTKSEFEGGHLKNAINIPLTDLQSNLHKLKDKNSPIIACCASGMRSASAKNILKSSGYQQVYNGGGWNTLQNKIG
ncbi:MAG: sulfurtransferase [Flavobacteriaceae bacterium CG_4_8_14_3_um_filter_34_10]|nr:rhodanese-like domain-containing protein [Flavobacteriia bacterium]OIP49856.1 MAG: sulfurtransferase [Flavobacteriaceae bacterium CG2_30_34_30]PIQ18920.1 MAG: sulfurtransferase [Flavobacteriaceae bacterium CG18_big_fil_WC_8_21_14_2_50_34_36]PIV48973.1 MAG: sulfurtransferase [Flavobacteriaceae bacterium CG02_land_8_20_14_3_00_34_13]PIX10507.1 MAG: sulfurtransferase [Flavobacteriaceae bacterium CG_4_8_14_3_um_filter_34_10]PJC08220.1 MAG: sulfurtransferase [Flavobacteriaceae bacterium CG_4_9_1